MWTKCTENNGDIFCAFIEKYDSHKLSNLLLDTK